ncbi:3-oxoadipate enol-lactonase [Yinghuangia sp. YIM S09857]|uniref:3-oxoadipate enol-lactonase n=1 Tax=Yinghuangia sp. YIM S09857 TaxID=3436929 RepID=UPI003F53DC75
MPATLNHRFDGPEGAPVIVLGSPLGADGRVWDAIVPALVATHRVLRFDTRGHGGSELPPGTPTMSDLAEDVVALADQYAIERFTYAGISLAGALGLAVALDAPERLDRLVVCCSGAKLGEAAGWHERAALVRRDGVGAVAETVVGRWFTPEYAAREPAVVADTLAMLRACPAEGYAAACDAVATFDARARLAAVTAPTLVIAAERDPSTPVALSEEVAAGIPGARLVLVPDAAHLVIVEKADEVAEILVDFLSGA